MLLSFLRLCVHAPCCEALNFNIKLTGRRDYIRQEFRAGDQEFELLAIKLHARSWICSG